MDYSWQNRECSLYQRFILALLQSCISNRVKYAHLFFSKQIHNIFVLNCAHHFIAYNSTNKFIWCVVWHLIYGPSWTHFDGLWIIYMLMNNAKYTVKCITWSHIFSYYKLITINRFTVHLKGAIFHIENGPSEKVQTGEFHFFDSNFHSIIYSNYLKTWKF